MIPLCEEVSSNDGEGCIKNYNVNLLEPIFDYLVITQWVVIILSVITCILSYKWRNLVNLIMYLDSIMMAVTVVIPSEEYAKYTNNYYVQRAGLSFLSFYCD